MIEDLNAAGYAFRFEWFAPFLEFRFPRYGTVAYEGIEMELRQAIEPWHVLGEEVAQAGTSRYVDSSVERLQVKATRLNDDALRDRLQRPAGADDAHRAYAASTSRACATRVGAADRRCIRPSACTRRWCSTSSTSGTAARSAAAPITWRTRAGATTPPSR